MTDDVIDNSNAEYHFALKLLARLERCYGHKVIRRWMIEHDSRGVTVKIWPERNTGSPEVTVPSIDIYIEALEDHADAVVLELLQEAAR